MSHEKFFKNQLHMRKVYPQMPCKRLLFIVVCIGLSPVSAFMQIQRLSYLPDRRSASPNNEFILNSGKAIDILSKNIPDTFKHAPDMSIFAENVKVSDPTGLKFQGKNAYDQAHSVLRGLTWVAIKESEIKTRLSQESPENIKARVSVDLWLSMGKSQVHVDVISYYHLNEYGKVDHHSVERIELNGTPHYGLTLVELLRRANEPPQLARANSDVI